MVRPMTGRPRDASSAATVELSTPPLIATAIGRAVFAESGMGFRNRGDFTKVGNRLFDGIGKHIHLLAGVALAKRKANARARLVGRQSDGGQHVRRLYRSARAGRARRNGESPKIERDHQRFALYSVERNVGGVRCAGNA